MTTDNGGPAFPVLDMEGADTPGMTLRDYMAAKAMQSLLLAYYIDVRDGGEGFDIATRAYSIADAMLEERNA